MENLSERLNNYYSDFVHIALNSVVGVALIVGQAIVFAMFWHWFLTPMGARPINIGWAVGVASMFALVRGMVFGDPIYNRFAVASSLFKLALLLAIGYGAYLHMRGLAPWQAPGQSTLWPGLHLPSS
jgi:hypothetical protein